MSSFIVIDGHLLAFMVIYGHWSFVVISCHLWSLFVIVCHFFSVIIDEEMLYCKRFSRGLIKILFFM